MMCRVDLQVQQLSETAAVVPNRPIRVNPQRLISGAPPDQRQHPPSALLSLCVCLSSVGLSV